MTAAVLMMGGLGVFVGIGLALASKIFYVYVDPKILEVEDALPGANCGGCGLPGCSANAEAIVAGKADPNSCVAAGPDTGAAIAAIMGVSITAKEPDIALPGCTYGVEKADLKFWYSGLNDCRAAFMINGGMKVCNIGCLGFGSCAAACPFDAIRMDDHGLPVVDEKKCTGCGTCERVCPKNIIRLSSITRRILREYTTEDCTTPCQRACPAGIDICEYIHQIAMGNADRSLQVIKERNPFAAVIGRICPAFCETQCRRNYVDEAVAINQLKCYAAEAEMNRGQRVLPYKAPATDRRVAVIGGGVEGLSTAYFTARLGHAVVVFEAGDKLGGLLRYAIAKYRLTDTILDWDINGILEMGVTAHTGKRLGKDLTIASLLAEGYEAVFLATGGWDSRLLQTEDASTIPSIPSSSLLIDFMKASDSAENALARAAKTVIIGGGKTAIEAAINRKNNGIENITVLIREEKQDLVNDLTENTAIAPSAIRIIYHSAAVRIFGEGDRLTGCEYTDLTTGENAFLEADSLIFSAGRYPELIFTNQAKPEQDDTPEPADDAGPIRWEAVGPYKRPYLLDETGFFSPADELTDFSGAIKAIGAGRRSAAAIHYLLYAIDPQLPEHVVRRESDIQNVDALENVSAQPRLIVPVATASAKTPPPAFSQEKAREEAGRCLQCGLICYQRDNASETAVGT